MHWQYFDVIPRRTAKPAPAEAGVRTRKTMNPDFANEAARLEMKSAIVRVH